MSFRLIDEHEKRLVGGLTGLFHISRKMTIPIFMKILHGRAAPGRTRPGNPAITTAGR